jgi:hypothetical protein
MYEVSSETSRCTLQVILWTSVRVHDIGDGKHCTVLYDQTRKVSV